MRIRLLEVDDKNYLREEKRPGEQNYKMETITSKKYKLILTLTEKPLKG